MADETSVTQVAAPTEITTQNVVAQYDLGDDPPKPETAPSVVSAGEDAPPSPAPRNPDGTFAKRTKHPERLAAMASALGISPEDQDLHETADLRAIVHDATLERLTASRAFATEQAQSRPSPEPPAPVPSGAGEPSGFSADAFDSDSYDPNIVKLARAFQDQSKLVRDLQAQLQQVQGYIGQQAQVSAGAKIDRVFDQWNDARFGKGRLQQLSPNSPEVRKRRAVVREAMELAGGEQAPVQAVLAKLEEARTNLYGKPEKTPAKPEANGHNRIAEWEEGGLARPTHRAGTAEPPGRVKAEKAVENFLREQGQAQLGPEAADEFLG